MYDLSYFSTRRETARDFEEASARAPILHHRHVAPRKKFHNEAGTSTYACAAVTHGQQIVCFEFSEMS